LGMKILKLGMETGPLVFWNERVGGVYILTELIFLTWFFGLLAFLAFLFWLGDR